MGKFVKDSKSNMTESQNSSNDSFFKSKLFQASTGVAGGVVGVTGGALLGVLFPIPVIGTLAGLGLGSVIGGTLGTFAGVGMGIGIQTVIQKEECKIQAQKECTTKSKVVITLDEMRKHTQYHSTSWISVRGKVYDITEFIVQWKSKHTSTEFMDDNEELLSIIEDWAGRMDVTAEFDKIQMSNDDRRDILACPIGVIHQ